MTLSEELSELDSLASDCKHHSARLAALDVTGLEGAKLATWVKNEFMNNFLPLLEGQIDAVKKDLVPVINSLVEEVDEIIDQNGDVLQPETTAKIVGVFEVGKAVAAELEKLAAGLKDDVRKRKIRDLIKGYRAVADACAAELAMVTLQPEDDDEEDDDEEEDLPAAGDVSVETMDPGAEFSDDDDSEEK